jgi:CheY-like chemotaxis protein
MIRVLVADDEPTARLLMSAALKKAGFEVCLAADGNEALRQFLDDPCDIVMLDVEMPGLNGYQVCAAPIQSNGPTNTAPPTLSPSPSTGR